jgi:hypothetical protein
VVLGECQIKYFGEVFPNSLLNTYLIIETKTGRKRYGKYIEKMRIADPLVADGSGLLMRSYRYPQIFPINYSTGILKTHN